MLFAIEAQSFSVVPFPDFGLTINSGRSRAMIKINHEDHEEHEGNLEKDFSFFVLFVPFVVSLSSAVWTRMISFLEEAVSANLDRSR